MNHSYLDTHVPTPKQQYTTNCPYCHSAHIRLMGSQQVGMQSKPNVVAFSPLALANIGMQISKRIHVSPMLGGLTGLVMGGLVFLFLNQHKPINVMQYQCEQCQEDFEIHHST